MLGRDLGGAALFAATVPVRALRRLGAKVRQRLPRRGKDTPPPAGPFLIGSIET